MILDHLKVVSPSNEGRCVRPQQLRAVTYPLPALQVAQPGADMPRAGALSPGQATLTWLGKLM